MTPTPPLIRPDFDSNSRSRRDILKDLAVRADVAGGHITISAADLHRLAAEKPPKFGKF